MVQGEYEMINGFDAKATCGGSGIKVDNSNIKLVKGDKGDRGEAGYTPYIGSNGNWWINGEDTGYKAKGDKGDKGDDYTITESDYQAIADRVPQPDLSDYVKNTDYATPNTSGVVKSNNSLNIKVDSGNGSLYNSTRTYSQYQADANGSFIGKGTLENVLAERLKEPQFELIEEIVLTEDVASIYRNAEPNGTPYNFTKVLIGIDNADATFDINVALKENGNEIIILDGVPSKYQRLLYDVSNGIGIGFQWAGNTNAQWTRGSLYGQILMPLASKITGLRAYGESQSVIPSGTNIKIYGIRG